MKAPAGWFPGTEIISMILKMMSGLVLWNGKPSPSALQETVGALYTAQKMVYTYPSGTYTLVSQSQDLGVQFSYHWKRFASSQRIWVWSSHSCIRYLFLSFFILITAQSLLFHISANQVCLINAITTINKHHMFNYLKTSYKRKESDK